MKQEQIKEALKPTARRCYANVKALIKKLPAIAKKCHDYDLRTYLEQFRDWLADTELNMKEVLLQIGDSPKGIAQELMGETALLKAVISAKEATKKKNRDLEIIEGLWHIATLLRTDSLMARNFSEMLTHDDCAEVMHELLDHAEVFTENLNEVVCSISVEDEDGAQTNPAADSCDEE